MFLHASRLLTACVSLAAVALGGNAWGQSWYNNPCCVQPIPQVHVQAQACYQTVPVTEIRQVRQTVQRPVVETAYVDQQVTEYRQVVENKACVVPTVSYQQVTECQTVQRDMGRWVTEYQCRPTMNAWQYDGRPDLLGAINRASYNTRMAFTPQVYARRVYVPNVVTHAVPVTRSVAVNGTKTVNYQVSRMVPVTTTRKVAVNTVKMVSQEIVTHHPVTTMKVVPMGSAMALSPNLSTTAIAPTPDPISTATGVRDAAKPTNNSRAVPPATDAFETPATPITPKKTTSSSSPSRTTSNDGVVPAERLQAGESVIAHSVAYAPSAASAVTATRVGRWVARRPVELQGPSFPETMVASTTTK